MNFTVLNQKTTNTVHQLFESKAIRITQFVVVAVVAILIIWDIYLYTQTDSTISEVIHDNSQRKLFVITWIWGVLASHLFVARKRTSRTVPEIIAILVLVLISVIIMLLGKFIEIEIPQYMHVILLVFGGITGYFLWPQKI